MATSPISLAQHMHPSRVVDLTATTKAEALAELVTAAATAPDVGDRDALLVAVRDRENLLSTGIGLGIAIPHARIASVTSFVVAVGRHGAGLPFDSIDNKPVHIVVLIAGPQDAKKPYLELLAQISKRLKLEDVRRRILAAPDGAAVVALLTDGA
jgi:mannitol/fructose-specific phosphotransferase system IIA component (Ntr-type)